MGCDVRSALSLISPPGLCASAVKIPTYRFLSSIRFSIRSSFASIFDICSSTFSICLAIRSSGLKQPASEPQTRPKAINKKSVFIGDLSDAQSRRQTG